MDHLTRQKLELRQKVGYDQPRRRGFSASTGVPASTKVIGRMHALNEEIYRTSMQFVKGLKRTDVFSESTEQNLKSQVQKMLGDHLTTMMENQAKTTSGYNMLVMQTVLEVFLTHWCSSIIEAFYPPQESFTDLLVQLSAQTTESSGK